MKKLLFILTFAAFGFLGVSLPALDSLPLAEGHAHNDYAHKRPLFDALEQGFCSVEADIWLVDGKLLVAHDLKWVKPERTLQALYLDPLKDRITKNGGRLYKDGPPCWLLIDIKSEANPTWEVLGDVLKGYTNILTAFTSSNTSTNAITIIISGNRPSTLKSTDSLRYAALDGELSDLTNNPPSNLVPWISSSWKKSFKWNGYGPFPENEQAKLQDLARQAHQQGRRIRFWGTPDNLETWKISKTAGVDFINTDKLAELAHFIHETK